jgi:hypothetical protein
MLEISREDRIRGLARARPGVRDGDFAYAQAPAAFNVGALSAGPAHLRNFVPDLAVVPAQNSRDLLYREAAQEQVAQLGQLRIGPFPPGVRGRRFVLNRGAVGIDDGGPNDAKESRLFGMRWPADALDGMLVLGCYLGMARFLASKGSFQPPQSSTLSLLERPQRGMKSGSRREG